jgi:hypothetical protein
MISYDGVSLPKVKAAAGGVFSVLSQYGEPDSGKSLGQKIALSHYGAYRESADAKELNKLLLFNGKTRMEVIKSAVSYCRGMIVCIEDAGFSKPGKQDGIDLALLSQVADQANVATKGQGDLIAVGSLAVSSNNFLIQSCVTSVDKKKVLSRLSYGRYEVADLSDEKKWLRETFFTRPAEFLGALHSIGVPFSADNDVFRNMVAEAKSYCASVGPVESRGIGMLCAEKWFLFQFDQLAQARGCKMFSRDELNAWLNPSFDEYIVRCAEGPAAPNDADVGARFWLQLSNVITNGGLMVDQDIRLVDREAPPAGRFLAVKSSRWSLLFDSSGLDFSSVCINLAITAKQLRSINVKYAQSNATTRSNLIPVKLVPEELKRLICGDVKQGGDKEKEEKQLHCVSDKEEGPKCVCQLSPNHDCLVLVTPSV